MVIVFPQATINFNKFLTALIKNSQADLFLKKSLSSYNMKNISKIVLIILENELVESYLKEYFSKSVLLSKFEMLVLKKQTSGSICTILMAAPILKNKSVIITSLDQITIGDKVEFNKLLSKEKPKVVVPIIKSKNPSLCYVIKDDSDNVIQLFEKKVVSDDAIVGIYLFRDFSDFMQCCFELLIRYKGFKNRIFYTSDVINNLMKNQKIDFPTLKLKYVKVRTTNDFKQLI